MTDPFTTPPEEDSLDAWHIARIEAGIAAANRGDFATDDEMDAIFSKYAPAPTDQS